MMKLGDEISAIHQAGADYIHIDIMDNHFAPNLTFGPDICAALHRQHPELPIDVHLMISPVDEMIEPFAKAGAARISIHPEATHHLNRSIQLIKDAGCDAGLVLNPATSIEWLRWCHLHLDFVLVMTVNPGFAGQELLTEIIPKISDIHSCYPNLPICVDGGINLANINSLAIAGATEFVAGSTIFNHNDYHQIIQSMRQKAMQIHATVT